MTKEILIVGIMAHLLLLFLNKSQRKEKKFIDRKETTKNCEGIQLQMKYVANLKEE